MINITRVIGLLISPSLPRAFFQGGIAHISSSLSLRATQYPCLLKMVLMIFSASQGRPGVIESVSSHCSYFHTKAAMSGNARLDGTVRPETGATTYTLRFTFLPLRQDTLVYIGKSTGVPL